MFAASKTAGVTGGVNYIEDVFSTWLYTGNSTTGGTQTITNNIDLSTKGGLVWIKGRSAASNHILTDTSRGAGTSASNNQALSSNLTTEEDLAASYDYLSAFNTTGFAVTQGGTTAATRGTNYNAVTYASWTFRKQPKFFDIVTYTGNGATTRQISHNLGSVPGCIIIKATSGTSNWFTYHRGDGTTTYTAFELNSTAASTAAAGTTPTSTYFNVQSILDSSYSYANNNGVSYVAYLFAHNAGGFGLTGTDNVISCGSVTTNGSGLSVTLGWEPQFVMLKPSSSTGAWYIYDNLRPFSVNTGGDAHLEANSTNVESFIGDCFPNATGFTSGSFGTTGQQLVYIAIRRGPMKVPTLGTTVYSAVARNGTSATATVTAGFTPDMTLIGERTSSNSDAFFDRLRGAGYFVQSVNATAEQTHDPIDTVTSFNMNGVTLGDDAWFNKVNATGGTYINWMFKRAPSFFDEVCYTGTASNTTQAHNLGVVPELIIVKGRSGATAGQIYASGLANTEYLVLNTTAAKTTGATRWNSTTPTSSVFSIGTATEVNTSAATYVAYLFATCAGVSKVGTYTGNGTTQTIDCGLTAGARFVIIKRTDSTGNWYVYDTTRGMTTLTDPYLLLNNTNTEVATLGSVTTVATGFALNSAILAAINVNAGTYIFLAIA